MSLFGARVGRKIGRWLRVTMSASGPTVSVGGRRGRVAVSRGGRKRASLNLGHGFRWTRSRG